MEASSTNHHNQGYWFVFREENNVIFSSNNITTIQNPQIALDQEPRYIIETGSRHYAQVTEPLPRQEDSESSDKGLEQQNKPVWDRNKVKQLLTLCLENKSVEKDNVWEEISSIIGATPEECSLKYRHLRRTYLRLLKKKRLGKDIKWIHYNTCEEVFTDLQALPPSVLEPWEDGKVRRLLTLYIENLQRFRDPNHYQKDVWKEIATQLGTTAYNCYHKFKNLRRSYLNWVNRCRQSGQGIKWPYHEYFERIYYNYDPNTRPWDKQKVKLLLEVYAQLAHKFRDPKLQKKELWKEVANKVGETPAACDKKFRNLKQTYIRLKVKSASGRLSSKWKYFKEFESIYGSSSKYSEFSGPHKVLYRTEPEKNYIHHLLEFYLENKDKFKDPLVRNRTLWKILGPKIGLTADECDKKFRDLKQTYIRLAWKKKQSGKCTKWPYFEYFEKIFEEPRATLPEGEARGADLDEVMRCEIRRVVNDVSERRASDCRFERLVSLAEESNQIQRDRNMILKALLDRK